MNTPHPTLLSLHYSFSLTLYHTSTITCFNCIPPPLYPLSYKQLFPSPLFTTWTLHIRFRLSIRPLKPCISSSIVLFDYRILACTCSFRVCALCLEIPGSGSRAPGHTLICQETPRPNRTRP